MALLGNTVKFICGSAALLFEVILICIATEQNWMVAVTDWFGSLQITALIKNDAAEISIHNLVIKIGNLLCITLL